MQHFQLKDLRYENYISQYWIWINNTNKILGFLKDQDADVVCLQEVTKLLEDTAKKEFSVLEDLNTGIGEKYVHKYFGSTHKTSEINVTGKISFNFEGLIEQGNYILSKHPFSHSDNVFFHREYEHMENWSSWKEEDHPRAFQHTIIQLEDGSAIQVVNLHGLWTENKLGDERTTKQVESIVGAVGDYPDIPAIILGDFNLLPSSDSLVSLNEKFTNLISKHKIKSTRPHLDEDNIDEGDMVVDYIFIDQRIKDLQFKVPETDISDHLPLILEFEVEQ